MMTLHTPQEWADLKATAPWQFVLANFQQNWMKGQQIAESTFDDAIAATIDHRVPYLPEPITAAQKENAKLESEVPHLRGPNWKRAAPPPAPVEAPAEVKAAPPAAAKPSTKKPAQEVE